MDVSNPVRRSKLVNLPNGGQTSVWYDFERLEKRCYTCQRLTHAQDHCPLFLGKGDSGNGRDEGEKLLKENPKELVIKKEDPLFGILLEDQVGIDPVTGRPKIDKDVLEGMRIYLMVGPDSERVIRESRILSSLEGLRGDPLGHYSLSLDPIPITSTDLDKGKGLVFNYELQESEKIKESAQSGVSRLTAVVEEGEKAKVSCLSSIKDCSTGYRAGFSEAGSSGTALKKRKTRRRPQSLQRKEQGMEKNKTVLTDLKKKGRMVGLKDKRDRSGGDGGNEAKAYNNKRQQVSAEKENQAAPGSNKEIVPNEGLSKIQ